MKKKKIGAVIMACAMACTIVAGTAAMTGCKPKITEFVMPEGGFDTETPVKIRFYHTMGADLRLILQNHIEEFNKLYPNIKVEDTQIGKYEDVRDQIVTEISAGAQPNLAYCYPDHVALFNQSGAVLSLNGFLPDGQYKDMNLVRKDGGEEKLGFSQEQKDSFIEGYYEEGKKFDDETNMYTLPFSKSTEVLFYNKTVFEDPVNVAKGLKVPETWDEMEEACRILKEIDPDCTPLGYDSESNWFITMCEQLGSPYTSSDGEHFRFDNETNRKFVEKLKGWFDKKYFTTQAINKTYTSNLFVDQKSYMCIGSSAGAKNQSPGRTDGGYKFEVGITRIPQAKQTTNPDAPNYDANYKAKVISQGPSICIFKQANPQEVLASWLFAKYFTTNIGFQAAFSAKSGYVPVIKTVTENETYKKNLDDANGYENLTYLSAKVCMEQESAYYTSPAFMGSSKARDEVGYLLQAVLTGSKTIDEAFKYAIEQCEYFAG